MVWLHALSVEGAGESPNRMEPDHAGLQSETGAEPGQLRETDGGGELKHRAAVFSPSCGCGSDRRASEHQPAPHSENLKSKTQNQKVFLRWLADSKTAKRFNTCSRVIRRSRPAIPQMRNRHR